MCRRRSSCRGTTPTRDRTGCARTGCAPPDSRRRRTSPPRCRSSRPHTERGSWPIVPTATPSAGWRNTTWGDTREQSNPGARRRRRRRVDRLLPHRKRLRRHDHREARQRRRAGAHVLLRRASLRVRPAHLVLAGRQGRVDRRLFTYVEADRRKYRYPVHYADVALMPERERIEREVRENRDDRLKLIEERLPEIGHCKFADYFTAAIGATLYGKFMANYTWKMW